MKRLAIITTHPIQYYAPIFQLLAQRGRVEVKVFYTWGEQSLTKHDPGFAKAIQWDIPLLEGYDYEWVTNTSARPGSDHFSGIVNPDITQQVLKWHPDATLVIGWAYKGHITAIRGLYKKTKLLFRGDSTLLNEPSGMRGIMKRIALRWIYSHFATAFYVGTNNKQYFERYGFSADQLQFAPHAVDNPRFSCDRSAEARTLRDQLNLAEENILIIYAGKFDEVKNTPLLAKAFADLADPNVHLLLTGSGAEHEQLKEIPANAPLTNNFHFMGFQNQQFMPVLYQAADLVCLPSKSETWGLMINEAMACSKAVLVSDKVGCAADLVFDNVNGAVFRSGDQTNLWETLRRLTKSKEQLVAYGLESARIIADWNFTKIAEAIEQTILE